MVGVRKIKILDSEGAKEKNAFKRDRQNASLNRWKENMYQRSIPMGNARNS